MSTEKVVRYTAEQFVLMAASVDYTKGAKLNALHQMLTQAATDARCLQSLESDVAGLVEAASKLALSVADETEALRAFKGSDGEGMAACKIAESRVVECTEQLQAALARFQQ